MSIRIGRWSQCCCQPLGQGFQLPELGLSHQSLVLMLPVHVVDDFAPEPKLEICLEYNPCEQCYGGSYTYRSNSHPDAKRATSSLNGLPGHMDFPFPGGLPIQRNAGYERGSPPWSTLFFHPGVTPPVPEDTQPVTNLQSNNSSKQLSRDTSGDTGWQIVQRPRSNARRINQISQTTYPACDENSTSIGSRPHASPSTQNRYQTLTTERTSGDIPGPSFRQRAQSESDRTTSSSRRGRRFQDKPYEKWHFALYKRYRGMRLQSCDPCRHKRVTCQLNHISPAILANIPDPTWQECPDAKRLQEELVPNGVTAGTDHRVRHIIEHL